MYALKCYQELPVMHHNAISRCPVIFGQVVCRAFTQGVEDLLWDGEFISIIITLQQKLIRSNSIVPVIRLYQIETSKFKRLK